MNRFLSELETIVNTDSGTADLSGCRKAADFFLRKIQAAGLCGQILECGTQKRPLVVGTSRDAAPDDRGRTYDFLLAGHLDTVYPAGTCAERPFRLEDSCGRACSAGDNPVRASGPGTVDMKAGCLLMIYLAEYLTAHHPKIRLCLAITSDEETGSASCGPHLVELGRKSEMAFVFEGGRKQGQFVSARKGCSKYEIRIHGRQAHAGTAPWNGASAIVELARWITALDRLKNYSRGTTINTGLISGGSAVNVVAGLACAFTEVRYTDPKELARIERAMKRLASSPKVEGTCTELICLAETSPLRQTPETEALMEKMKEYGLLAGTAQPVDFVSAGGLSDANRLAVCGIPIIDGCGPGGGFPHSEKEFLSIDTLQSRYAYFAGLLPWLCTSAP